MVDDAFDSRLELVIVEGNGTGTRRYLNRTHLTLARLDPAEEPQPSVLTFDDHTVSRVHAALEWDDKRHGFVLHHRSRTNFTVINGVQVTEPQLLNPGDKIKLGQLLLELRRLPPSEAPPEDHHAKAVETYLYLVVLSGPDKGQIHPLNYNRMAFRAPMANPVLQPCVLVKGVGDVQARFVYHHERYWIESETGVRPILMHFAPGLAYERVVSCEGQTEFPKNDMLVCGEAAMLQAGVERAGELAEMLRKGVFPAEAHPALPFLRFNATPVWNGGEQYVLRVLSGDERGSVLWIKPSDLTAPIRIARRGTEPRPDIDLTDSKAGSAAVEFAGNRVLLRNEDDKLPLIHNWETVTPREEVYLVSGDRIRLGMTMISFEYLPAQQLIEAHALKHGDKEMPLIRETNSIGYVPENELRINDRRLGATHGKIIWRDGDFLYHHLHNESTVKIGDQSVAAGEEARLQVGAVLELAEGVEAQFVQRASSVRPSDPVLIGPTQAEIDARRGGGE